MFRCVGVILAAILCVIVGGCSNDPSIGSTGAGRGKDAAPRKAYQSTSAPARLNKTPATPSIRIITGEQGSAYSRTIADLVTILDHDQWRFKPLASQGPLKDLLSILNRPDIDLAIVQTDAIQALPDRSREAARQRLRYLFPVPGRELHVIASRDITEIRQLEGLRVNVDRPESDTYQTARQIFERIGVRPEFATDDLVTGYRRLQSGEIQAVLVLASSPSSEVLAFSSEGRFHLVPVPYESGLSGYSPDRFTAEEYPHLIDSDQEVETIAVDRVLAVRSWREESPHYKRLAHLAEAVISRFSELQKPGHNSQWKKINLSKSIPDWQRFKPVQDILDRRSRQAVEADDLYRREIAGNSCLLSETTSGGDHSYDDYSSWLWSGGGRRENAP